MAGANAVFFLTISKFSKARNRSITNYFKRTKVIEKFLQLDPIIIQSPKSHTKFIRIVFYCHVSSFPDILRSFCGLDFFLSILEMGDASWRQKSWKELNVNIKGTKSNWFYICCLYSRLEEPHNENSSWIIPPIDFRI